MMYQYLDDMKACTLINMITDYAIEHRMSLEEIDKCMDKVAEVYYSDGVVIREAGTEPSQD